MSDWYRLDDNNRPVKLPECQFPSDSEWGSRTRRPGLDELYSTTVSTVFLGLDHAFGDEGPLLFETLVQGRYCDQEMERYRTWDEAVAGHARWVRAVTMQAAGAFADVEVSE